jgi:hypothetical protein
LEAGDVGGATEYTAQARLFIEERGMRHYMPLAELAEGRQLIAQGELLPALDKLSSAEQAASEMGMRPAVLHAQSQAAQVLDRLGRHSEAEEKTRQARDTASAIADLFDDDEMRGLYLRKFL